mgnify:CR=1 FL=1
MWANVRSDTREILGVVGPEFVPVQNIDLGKFADAMVGANAAVKMETCGSLLGGRKVFLLAFPARSGSGRTGTTSPSRSFFSRTGTTAPSR